MWNLNKPEFDYTDKPINKNKPKKQIEKNSPEQVMESFIFVKKQIANNKPKPATEKTKERTQMQMFNDFDKKFLLVNDGEIWEIQLWTIKIRRNIIRDLGDIANYSTWLKLPLVFRYDIYDTSKLNLAKEWILMYSLKKIETWSWEIVFSADFDKNWKWIFEFEEFDTDKDIVREVMIKFESLINKIHKDKLQTEKK